MSRVAECQIAAGNLQECSTSLATSKSKKAKDGELFRTICLWVRRSRQRRELRELISSPDETFKDIGLSRYDVQREECKPFWRE